ncbi:unnamed protein product [Blepharisma stoltei]|uniref:Uncharacterized protein n=1 Tax=Blepharisma stoltei TaxID=1481888 RepID=A0AAU9KPM8_9CILI|nr:unnamed protein product [Blepharisma stoltei]
MPLDELCCHSVIFNGNILISGSLNSYIWLYSIDTDSFSVIPYEFDYYKIKILINAGRLYLIEDSLGKIYESEDEYAWNQIANSVIGKDSDWIYCTYNKGWIYSACYIKNNISYSKFNLNEKFMINLL